MTSSLVDSTPRMAYVDRHELLRSMLTEDVFRARRQEQLDHSTTVYIGNLSFFTTEDQIVAHFSPYGHIRDVLMGLNETTRTPCGFCFLVFESQEAAAMAVSAAHGTLLDDRVVSVGWDVGCDATRRWGRGAHGGQVVDGVRQNLDDGRGGLGTLRRDALGATAAAASTLTDSDVVTYQWVPPKPGKRNHNRQNGPGDKRQRRA